MNFVKNIMLCTSLSLFSSLIAVIQPPPKIIDVDMRDTTGHAVRATIFAADLAGRNVMKGSSPMMNFKIPANMRVGELVERCAVVQNVDEVLRPYMGIRINNVKVDPTKTVSDIDLNEGRILFAGDYDFVDVSISVIDKRNGTNMSPRPVNKFLPINMILGNRNVDIQWNIRYINCKSITRRYVYKNREVIVRSTDEFMSQISYSNFPKVFGIDFFDTTVYIEFTIN